MAAVLVGILIYLCLAVATCAFVGARRAKLRRCVEAEGESNSSPGLAHGYEGELVMAGSAPRALAAPDRQRGAHG